MHKVKVSNEYLDGFARHRSKEREQSLKKEREERRANRKMGRLTEKNDQGQTNNLIESMKNRKIFERKLV